MINATDNYWDKPKIKEPKVVMSISHVAKVDRFIITEQEYKAVKKIIKALRSYIFRVKIERRIRYKKELAYTKKRFKQMITKDSHGWKYLKTMNNAISPKNV